MASVSASGKPSNLEGKAKMEAVKSFSLTSFVTPQREILSSKPRAAIWALSWFVNSRSVWVSPHISISHSGNSVFNRENALMSRSCCFWLQALPTFTILKLFASDVSLFCVTAFGMYIILVLGNIFCQFFPVFGLQNLNCITRFCRCDQLFGGS